MCAISSSQSFGTQVVTNYRDFLAKTNCIFPIVIT